MNNHKKVASLSLMALLLAGQANNIVNAGTRHDEKKQPQSGIVNTPAPLAEEEEEAEAGFVYDKTSKTLTIKKGILRSVTPPSNAMSGDTISDIQKIVFEQGVISQGNVFADGNRLFNFKGLTNLKTIEGLENLDTSRETNMKGLFKDAHLETLDLSHFDTSKVENMQEMFENCTAKTINLSNFDTSNVTNMTMMFFNTPNLKNIDVSKFNTSKVTSMTGMFAGKNSMVSQYKVIETLNLSNFDTANVESMNEMFNNLVIGKLDVSNFDTHKVQDMTNIFGSARSGGNAYIKSISLGNKFNFINEEIDPDFPERTNTLPPIETKGQYTGKWTNLGEGALPKNQVSWTSRELTEKYSGDTSADTYVWETNKAGGDVTVKYINDTTGASISDDIVLKGEIGGSYTAQKKSIPGYTFKEVRGIETGTFTDNAQTVTYVYTKNATPVKGGDITVHYQNEAGQNISPDVKKTGNIGDEYITEKKEIQGYTFKTIQGKASGLFSDTPQTVTYIYKSKPTPTPDNKVVNVYRLYNKKSMEHMYTADINEYKKLPEISKDWVREGVNFKEYQKASKDTKAIYRVYNPKSGEHINTSDQNEIKVLATYGWKNEGVSFYAPKTSGKDIYRLFNPKAGLGAHFVTADANEKKTLTTKPNEWKYEGVAWKAIK